MPVRVANAKDLAGGLLMLALGAATAMQAVSYDIGTLRRMGPGFFPLCLGILLALIGILIVVTTRRPAEDVAQVASRAPEWRGWICICLSIAAFVILGRYGGLVPATFAITFIAALGDRDNSVLVAFGLAAALTLVTVAIFWWLLQVAFPLFRWGWG